MKYTGHVDTFAEDRLPEPHLMPELRFALPELSYPERLNAASYLLDRHVASGNGGRRCVLAPGAAAWTYAELQAAANRIARVLVDDLGVEPGNRVLLRAPNTPMLAACWFGALKAGAVAVTTMPLYRATELRHIMERAQVKHALCDVRLRDDLDAACAQFGGVRTACFGGDELDALMRGKSDAFDAVETAAEDVALIAFTSGTTGEPKAAMHYHRDILATCDSYGRHVLRLRDDDLVCGSPPLAFTFGLGGLLLFPLAAGAATLLLEKAGPEHLLEAIGGHGATTVFTAPIAYRTMCASADRHDLRTLRTCVSAGETLPKAVWEAWREKTGVPILDGIGSTEMLHIFVGSPKEDVRAGSTGRAVAGYVAEVHGDDGKPVAPGTIGRLAVKGPTGCKYLQDERQALYVANGWNYPGDAYRMDDDGYFWYVARTDDMIVSAGYNVSGPEVEQALIAHADVREVAVVGKRDPEKETHIVKAFVVLADGCASDSAKADELREFCKSVIAPFKAPREIEFVHELPRTQTGKLQRYKLRER
ncbi:MAG: benzoate-CoA ligase family protein [Candidatus Eremiobacteraeota bacterium]|nr:benzoate-CoA ligase family protein [Candidatus Eremiobacteraeota bacterium]